MERDFWLNKWETGEIGFHQLEYNPYLLKFWEQIRTDKKAVFVPLCGKTKDILYLSEQGHQVVGVELSECAVKEFFEENQLDYTVRAKDQFRIYTSERITIYVGDLFELTSSWVADCEYLYDRASIVALPLEMRKRYADYLKTHTKIKRGLMIVMSFEQGDVGPPFSISENELNILFEKSASFDLLEEKVESGDRVSIHKDKIDQRVEQAYLFRRT